MNIFDDENHNLKYVFHIGDILGNLLFTLRLNNIKPEEISKELLEKYMCILIKKYTEAGIKAEFILTQEEIQKFIKSNSDLYKSSDDNKKIFILQEITPVELAQRHHNCMPFDVLNATVDGKVQKEVLDAYNDIYNVEKPTVLEKKTSN